MKVCMVVPDRNVKGGIASVVNGYRERGFGNGYEIIYVESYCDGSRWKKLRKALRGYAAFLGVLLGRKPDLVHIHSSFGPSFYRKIPFIYMASFKKIPIINHIHGAEFDAFYRKASPRRQKLVRKVYEKCRMLIALSDEWRGNLEMIVAPERITVLENYCRLPGELPPEGSVEVPAKVSAEVSAELQAKVSAEHLSKAPMEHSEKKKRQILFLGELGKRKGCYDIPEIYRRTIEKAGKVSLVMGGDGELMQIKALFEEKGLSKEVSFPGWVRGEEKERLLKESGIFLFPSYYEGMPMAVLEAMAHKLAIVTTNAGGIPKLIKDGVTGRLCEPGNVEELSDALAELLTDEEKRKRLGEAAYREAAKKYSMTSHIERLLAIYRQVSEG